MMWNATEIWNAFKPTLMGALVLSSSLAVAQDRLPPLKFDLINQVFNEIATQVVEDEQILDRKGNKIIRKLEVGVDPKFTSLDGKKLGVSLSVETSQSAWSAAKSTVDFSLYTHAINKGADFYTFAQLGLTTDTTELVRYALSEINKKDSPCADRTINRAKDLDDLAFNKLVCAKFTELLKMKQVGELVSATETLLLAQSELLEKQIKNSPHSARSLNSELEYIRHYLEVLQNGVLKNKGVVTGLNFIDMKPIGPFGGTTIAGVQLSLLEDSVNIAVEVSSKDMAAVWEPTAQQAQTWLYLIQTKEPQLNASIRRNLKDVLKTVKDVVIYNDKKEIK